MNRRIYELLTALLEEGSFTAAAERVYISQPALSQHIRKEEERLGISLLNRDKASITLTDAGRIYYQGLREMVEMEQKVQDEIAQVKAGTRLELRFGITRSRMTYWLPLILPQFFKDHPNVTASPIEGNSQSLLTGLKNSTMHFALLPKNEKGSGIAFEPLYEEKLVLVGMEDPSLPFASRDYIEFEELHNLPMIALYRGFNVRSLVEQLFHSHEVTLNLTRETDSNESAYRLASSGLGFAILSDLVPRYILPVYKTKVWQLGKKGITRTIGVHYRQDNPPGGVVRDFCDRFGRIARGQYQAEQKQ